MIIDIRRYMKTDSYRTVLWFTVAGLIIAMVLPPVFSGLSNKIDEWVVQVNNDTISFAQFRQKVIEQQQYISFFKQQYGPYADALLQSMGMSSDPRETAFRFAVQDELINQVAAAIGIEIHDDLVKEQLQNQRFVQQELSGLVPGYVFDATGSINQLALKRHLKQIGMSVGDFNLAVKNAIARNTVMSIIAVGNYATDAQVRQSYINEKLGKKFAILGLSFDKYLKNAREKSVSDQELQAFFDKQNSAQRRYWVPEKRAGIKWKFSPETYGIAIDDSAMQSYYEDHKTTDYVDNPTQVQVRRILFKVDNELSAVNAHTQAEELRRELLANPDQFAAKAKDISEDKENLIQWVTRSDKDRELERAAFLLKNNGDISSVIRTTNGFEIIQRVDRKERTYVPFAKVKNDIKTLLLNKKFKNQFVADMEEALRSGDKNKAIADLVLQKGGKKTPVALINNDNTPLARALFGTKKDDMNFYVEGNEGYAIQVETIQERYLPSLDSIKKTVLDDLHEDQAMRSLQDDIVKAKDMIHSGHSLEQVKNALGGTISHTPWIKRDEAEAAKIFEQYELNPERALQLEKIGALLTHSSGKNAVLVQLNAVQEIDPIEFASQRAEMARTIDQEQIPLILQGFVASLRKNATIKVNESALNLYQ
ncbi:MAG TPA: SurA N-terminal domain-containing protein [Candidatus Dependentiae bacterium]|nr:SurA N-terminal domain-containing protein [Candidatus Dependentiae bacterium]HRQ62485.1 SurA N-terminal domain-containing protein [Candidatus Dependentiae bacterium]